MPATHKGTSRVLDELELTFDAVATASQAIGNLDGTGVNHGAASDDEADAGVYVIKWPGVVGGATSTVAFVVQDSADNITFVDLLTTPAVDTDGTGALDPKDYEMAVPQLHRQYTRLRVVIAVAALAAGSGVITAGFVRGATG